MESERDSLRIDIANKKEQQDTVMKEIRDRLTEKESQYGHLFKEMSAQLSDLTMKNNDLTKQNSDLIKKMCCSEISEIESDDSLLD